MTADTHGLRALADAQRRGADRLTLLRLRLANTLAEVGRAEAPEVRGIGERVHERWIREEHPELGRLATGLRAAAKQLDQEAVRAERLSGRRMGGYTGAGFLGRGREASRHVHEVAAVVAAEPAFVGTEHGASIGGFPLQPSVQEGFLAHPSSALGIETPDFDEDDEG
ncbi:hypothetical protein [Brachybacterium paraconglomeratum]|uniref:hypothetical protein n=1 Tax=Brachybacterium paraconglomeratum TaxID=173362 RepID=UPI003827A39C